MSVVRKFPRNIVLKGSSRLAADLLKERVDVRHKEASSSRVQGASPTFSSWETTRAMWEVLQERVTSVDGLAVVLEEVTRCAVRDNSITRSLSPDDQVRFDGTIYDILTIEEPWGARGGYLMEVSAVK